MRYILLSLAVLFFCIEAQGGMRFDGQGKFRILQFADIHYAAGSPHAGVAAGNIAKLLDAERPDMVVFTGDAVTSNPSKRGWDEVLAPLIERGIPYAVVLGNHDDEQDWTRAEIRKYVSRQPGSLTPKAGDYTVEVADRRGKRAAVLYFMDSNAYAQLGAAKGYGWLGFEQVAWYRRTSRKYTRKNGGPLPALAFFHIPLREYAELSETMGSHIEKECPGLLNTGMFAAMVECGDVMGLFVGHDHNNDYLGTMHGVALAYGRFSGGRNTYNDTGPGARVVELTLGCRGFDTHIRTVHGEKLNETAVRAGQER